MTATSRLARSVIGLPRRGLQARLALLYCGLFLVSGFGLLAITITLWGRSTRVSAGGRTVAVPANQPLPPDFAARGISASRQHDLDVHRLLAFAGIALVIMVVVAVVLGWVVAGRLLRPLRTMTATARHISANNLHERLNLGGRDDEVHELGATLDDLFGRLEASFESQRHFVSNASHELRTPLTLERTLLQVALADPNATAAELRATCERLLRLGGDQERLIEALLTLAEGERGIEQWEPFDLATVTEHAVTVRRADAERRGLRVDAACAHAPAFGEPSLVESLVGNLVDNAIRHNVADGWVSISTFTDAGRATLAVTNTGPLIDDGDVGRLLEPFQRHGAERVRLGDRDDGHGLGLAIVRAIAGSHEADLTARARTDGGLDIEVTFPARAGVAAQTGRRP